MSFNVQVYVYLNLSRASLIVEQFSGIGQGEVGYLAGQGEDYATVLSREGEDIEKFFTLVPKVL